jgi:tight adherence protein C
MPRIRIAIPRSAAARRRDLDRDVPQLLDLLASGSAAGLSAVSGFRRAVSAIRGPLADELRRSLGSVDLGSRWRTELAAVSERLDLPDLRRVVAILARTETLGTSLSDATRELAADVRSARRAAVAERARTAPVKMLFPLVFLILPAFLLLTVVPVLLTTVRSIR